MQIEIIFLSAQGRSYHFNSSIFQKKIVNCSVYSKSWKCIGINRLILISPSLHGFGIEIIMYGEWHAWKILSVGSMMESQLPTELHLQA